MILFFYLGFKCEVISRRSLLYCGGCTYTNVLPHWNAIPQTEDTPSHRVAVYRHIGSDPIEKSFSNLPHHTHIELYNIVMVVVSQTLARKCTVPVSYPRTQCSNRNAQDYIFLLVYYNFELYSSSVQIHGYITSVYILQR